jgi:hypothetical protein
MIIFLSTSGDLAPPSHTHSHWHRKPREARTLPLRWRSSASAAAALSSLGFRLSFGRPPASAIAFSLFSCELRTLFEPLLSLEQSD